ncbi:protein suppressor of variegation 3-7 [Drosophila bipectinata]|uniref:protein suppressor of variegation 3-7 n=1 Tax=Drosophila bipectinata TaxID=42026 RepID=UPI001C896936|nr:protein suppressor of variegation 3-7 [Drosophila bipectinata]
MSNGKTSVGTSVGRLQDHQSMARTFVGVSQLENVSSNSEIFEMNEETDLNGVSYGTMGQDLKFKSRKWNRFNTVWKRKDLFYEKPMPQTRQELLQSIGEQREVLGAYFQRLKEQKTETKAIAAAAINSPPVAAIPVTPARNSYDLFFESACISVKSLPPKLAAEAKSRISQIITEFEIRAISQQEELQAAAQQGRQHRLDEAAGVVYEFHPCP